MKMKKIAFILLLVLLALPAYASIKPDVVVSAFNFKGDPYVGKNFTLSVTLSNLETTACAKQVSSSIVSGFPFINSGIGTISVGDICYGNNVNVDFPLKIDPTAVGGSYQLKINSDYQTTTFVQYSTSSPITIFVAGSPKIDAHITGSEPIDIYPGDTATITLTVDNSGDFRATSVSATMTANSPIDVKAAKSYSFMGQIDPKQSKSAQFTLGVPKDAKAIDYPVVFIVGYVDEKNTMQQKTFNLILHVKKKAMFEVVSSELSLYPNANSEQIQVQIKNTGTDAARRVKVRVIPQFPFSTDGSIKYIDILEPNKSAPVDFTINTDKDATKGQYSLDVLLDFEDAQGKEMQDTTKLVLGIKPKTVLMSVFIDFWFLWGLLLIIIIVNIVKRFKKKPKN